MTDFDDLLEETATVRRRTLAEGDFGADQTATWADNATGVKGALQTIRPSERLGASKIEESATHWWYCASSVDIKGRDELVVDSVTYDVLGPASDLSAVSLGMQRVMLRHREET